MSTKKIKALLGVFTPMEFKTLDENSLIVKSGINIIAGLSGEGKSTFVINFLKTLKHEIAYINYDQAPNYDFEMLNPPSSLEETKKLFELLLEELTEDDIVVIDSLKAFCNGCDRDVEDNKQMYSVMMALRKIVSRTQATLILVHHVFKPKNVKTMASSLYGSRALEEQSDSAFILETVRGKQIARIVKSRAGLRKEAEIVVQEVIL